MYGVKLETRAPRQVGKLDLHIKEVVKRKLRKALVKYKVKYLILK